MPNVASDLKFHGLSRLQQQAAKQAYASASPATTPFDSILDETTRPDPAPRPQRAADDNAPRTERGQRAKSADRADRPDRAAKSDDNVKPSDAEAAAKADSTADSTNTDNADAKAIDTKTADSKSVGDKASDQIETGDDVTIGDATPPLTDAKPVDAGASGLVAVVIDPAAVPVANTALPDTKGETKTQTPAIAATAATAASDATKAIVAPGATATTAATAATAVTTPAPTTASKAAVVTTAATATSGQPDAMTADGSAETTLADAPSNALAALAAKPEKTDKTDLKSDKKTEADKKAASAQTALKPAATPDPEAAQAANGEPAKDTGAHVRAEAAANSHRGGGDTASTSTKDSNAVAATPKAPDLTPPPGLTVQTSATAQASGAPAATVAPTVLLPSDSSEPAVPIAGVAFEITSKALSGRNQFDIRLDPPDLGRIHVRLDVDRDGNVITHMVADRTDTLDLLRKDTSGLERALQDAGLKTSDNSLQFSLRDQQANHQQQRHGGESAHVVVEDEQLAAIEPAQRNYARYNVSTGGLDIRV